MSIAENCAIMRQVQTENRRRLYTRIDRALSKRQDSLGDLYRAGLDASASNRAERQEHRLSVAHSGYDSLGAYWVGWRAVCACGWTSETVSVRRIAEQIGDRERDHIFRPLSAGPVAHSPILAASVEGAA